MAISIIPVGVNSSFTLDGFHSNYLVRYGKRQLLIDCGSTAARALREIGVSLAEIDSVYISHLHLDHIGGLFDLALQRMVAGLPPPALHLHHSISIPVWDHFLSSMLSRYIDAEGKARDGALDHFFQVNAVESTVENDTHATDIRGLSVRLVSVPHVPGMSCHGVVLDDRIFVTTDTTFIPETLDKLANRFGLEAIFHDCAFNPAQSIVHTTYEQLLDLPEDLRQLLILTHYEDDTEQRDSKLPLAEAGKEYKF